MPLPPPPSDGLSLIVATKGRVQPLARLLASLAIQNRSALEVIVVDQNGSDLLDALLASFADRLPIRHLRAAPGLSKARNLGLEVSRGAIVGFPDDDCWYPAGVVATVMAFFERHPAADLLLGRTVDADGRLSLNPSRPRRGEVTRWNVWFSGNSNTLFVRRSLATRLRFDPTLGVGAASAFQSGEETDLILRGLGAGCQATFDPDLVIHHEQVEEGGGRQQLRRAWRYSLGFGRVLRLHYPPPYAAYRVSRSFFGAAAAMLRGRGWRSASRLVWTAGTVAGWLRRP